MKYYGRSDIGLIRKTNQDYYQVVINSLGYMLAIVCDGVGGGLAGDVASKDACTVFAERFLQLDIDLSDKQMRNWIKTTIYEVNDHVLHLAGTSDDYRGMSTTLVAALLSNENIYIINVGDSRAYGFKDDELKQLTKDHTLIQSLIDQKLITNEQAFDHPHRHILTNAIGIPNDIKIDIFKIDLDYGLILLASDGLHGYMMDDEIKKIIAKDKSLKKITDNLIKNANKKGGFDNTTIILIGDQTYE